MIVKIESEDVVLIEPESVAEELALRHFDSGSVTIRVPRAFEPNVHKLEIKAKS